MTQPLNDILVYGGGMAGYLCATALAHKLPKDINITLIETPEADKQDPFYGTVTSPTTYDFLLNLGITEPELLLGSDTAFSLGTHYINWGCLERSWIQGFHSALPTFEGVEFHHYLIRQAKKSSRKFSLEPYIMSVQAAYSGVFAHPPEEKKIPLAALEYGYQFSSKQWVSFLEKRLEYSRVTRIKTDIEIICDEAGNTVSTLLADGRTLQADLFINCSGQYSKTPAFPITSTCNRRQLCALVDHTDNATPHKARRTLISADYGWQSETPLRSDNIRMTVYAPEDEAAALKAHGSKGETAPIKAQIGVSKSPWKGNCLFFGHAAATIEPLTPAPMILLQRDVERLLEFIPVSNNMTVERREYNRRFHDDYAHADLFQRAFFETKETPDTPYWKAARLEPLSDKAIAKIKQFKSRGVHVQYDYEPFSPQDWAMQHFGMGRMPSRYDPLADRIPEEQMEKTLIRMQHAIEAMAKKMPPHDIYMSGLLKYLREKHV